MDARNDIVVVAITLVASALALWLFDLWRARGRLRQADERLQLALWASAEELWELDAATDRLQRRGRIAGLHHSYYDTPGASLQDFLRIVHRDDQAAVAAAFERVISGADDQGDVAYRVRSERSGWMWLQSRGRAVSRDAQGRARTIVGTSRDITELKEREQRLRFALVGAGEELWEIDTASGALRRENAFVELLPVAGEIAATLRQMAKLIHPDDVTEVGRQFAAAMSGEQPSFHAVYRFCKPDGTYLWLDTQGKGLDFDKQGRPRRVLGTTRDISELKSAEEDLRRLNEELEARVTQRTADLSSTVDELRQANLQLRDTQRQLVEAEKMASLGSLVAGVAHEINTPLGISVTAASQLDFVFADIGKALPQNDSTPLRGVLDKGKRCVQLVLANLERASHLVKSFKQVAVDQSSESARRIVVAQYLDEILASLNPRLKHTPHRVLIECPLEIEVETYPGALYQIVVNFVINSLVHAFGDGVAGTIRMAVRRDASMLELVYSDDGAGMTDDVRTRIFEPFFTTRRGSGGTGLGLHIVYNLVTQLLRGTIECRSAVGGGTTFTVRFPVN